MNNPCLSCGACCAYYRVSFYWGEAEVNAIPAELTIAVTPHRLAMRGTERTVPRCDALLGTIGTCVNCAIYAARFSPCHGVKPSWHDGPADAYCDGARAAWGLPPLQPAGPGESPTPATTDLPHVA